MTVSKTLRFTILARDGFECVYCHATDKPLEVDHIRPIALGGTDTPENLVAACEDCNGGKAAAHLGNLESVPRPTALSQAGEIAFLQRRYQEMSQALARANERQELLNQQIEALERRNRATAKQLEAALERLRGKHPAEVENAKLKDWNYQLNRERSQLIEFLSGRLKFVPECVEDVDPDIWKHAQCWCQECNPWTYCALTTGHEMREIIVEDDGVNLVYGLPMLECVHCGQTEQIDGIPYIEVYKSRKDAQRLLEQNT